MTQDNPNERRRGRRRPDGGIDWQWYRDNWQPGLWRCRGCGVLNDFEGQAALANEELKLEDDYTPGRFATLAVHECAGCGFTLELEPFYFIVPKGGEFMHLETGFTWEPYGKKGTARP